MLTLKKVVAYLVVRLLSLCISSLALLTLLFQRLRLGKDYLYVKPRPTPPPILNDKKWGTHNYVTLKKQGFKLHYVEAGDSSKPLLLCLHGFPECWFAWRHQLQEFSTKYWVVAVDLPGYGDSDKPKALSNYEFETLVEDIRQFIEALGKQKCIIMAHDWGALLAWGLVIQHPELFTAHISLNGPHPGAFIKHIKSSWRQMTKSWYMYFFQTPWLPELMCQAQDLKALSKMYRGKHNNTEMYPDEVIEAFKYYYSKDGAFTCPINYYRNISFGDDSWNNLPKVKVPTLIVWGSEDVALEKVLAEKGAEECVFAQVKYVEGASHFVQEDNPKVVNKFIWEFLNSDKWISAF